MWAVLILSAGFLFGLNGPSSDPCACLPGEIKPTDVVSVQTSKRGAGRNAVKKIMVQDKLKELGARCQKGKLVDSTGKKIYFYRLVGCWGNPPVDYQDMLERQNRELERLRKRYRVIEMTCNPSGEQIL